MATNISRVLRLLALAASLAIAGSSPALAAQDSASATTTLTISGFIEISGVAATLNYSPAATYGGEVRTNAITGDNGTSSYFDIGTNSQDGYRFSISMADMPGASYGGSVPATAHSAQLAKMRVGAQEPLLDLTGLVGLAQYSAYTGPSETLWPLWECDNACVTQDTLSEGYQLKVQLAVPLGLAADVYSGSFVYLVETL